MYQKSERAQASSDHSDDGRGSEIFQPPSRVKAARAGPSPKTGNGYVVCRNTALVHSKPRRAARALATASLRLVLSTATRPAPRSVLYSRKYGMDGSLPGQAKFGQSP